MMPQNSTKARGRCRKVSRAAQLDYPKGGRPTREKPVESTWSLS